MSFIPHPALAPYSYPSVQPTYLENVSAPSPVYIILIVGMVFFMAANIMPNLLPAQDRVWNIAPMVLQWGFVIIIFALLVQMTGVVPGVPAIHITYVHMAIATLLFVLLWNHMVSELPAAPSEEKSSSSSSSKDKPSEEKKKEEKKEKEKEPEPSPWDDLRAHPSAFLTTRLNRMMPWPFPMGRADRTGIGLWWESGMPAHVGHFNRPDPEVAKKAEEEVKKKKKEKEEREKKEKEEKEKKEKVKEKEKEEKEAAAKAKMKEEEAKKAKEAEKVRIENAKKKAVEDRQKQKLWRTKCLAMIIGISLLNKTLAFPILLFFSLQIVSQELNAAPFTPENKTASSPSSSSKSSSSSPSRSRSSSASSEDARRAEKEKLAKMEPLKEKEKSGSSSSSSKPSRSSTSSSSRDKEKQSSASSKSSSSSSTSSSKAEKPVSSEAVQKASGSQTVTNVDPGEGGFGVPYKVGFAMHYIHLPDTSDRNKLDLPSTYIPSEGMSHPLMTTTYKQWAN